MNAVCVCVCVCVHVLHIGVGNGGGGGGGGGRGAMPPPIFYPRDLINIYTCSADRRDRSVYYVRPPKNVIASYACHKEWCLPHSKATPRFFSMAMREYLGIV